MVLQNGNKHLDLDRSHTTHLQNKIIERIEKHIHPPQTEKIKSFEVEHHKQNSILLI